MPAEASAEVVGEVLHLSFGIPQGYDGQAGVPGPPFAQAVVDGVTTLPPGSPATVDVSFDGTYVHFTFGIPQGEVGLEGPTGPQGPPGEVSTAQMETAISSAMASVVAGSSANSNAVAVLPFSAAESYDQGQCQTMIDKMNELILTLRR